MKAQEDQIRAEIIRQGGSELEFKARDTELVPYSYNNRDGKTIEDAGRIDTIEFIVALTTIKSLAPIRSKFLLEFNSKLTSNNPALSGSVSMMSLKG